MHIKQLAPARVQVKDATTGEVEAVFATLGVKDHDGDIILPGAIKDGTAVAISAFGHSVWKGAPPAGVGTIHEEGDELVLKGRYFLDTDHGRNDFHTVKGLAEAGKGEWSFGLANIEATKGTHNGVNGNLIKSVDVPEVSPVFIGAGINTRTLVAKSAAIEALTQAGIDADEATRLVEADEGAPTKGTKFSEHLATVLADVKTLTARAEEVVALRAAKGKTISDEAQTALADIGEELERIKSLISEQPAPTQETPPSEGTAKAIEVDGVVYLLTDSTQEKP